MATKTPTAVLVRKPDDGWQGDARHYRLSQPIKDDDGNEWSDVIVSAVVASLSGPETYIFPATKDGEAAHFGELVGSLAGDLGHDRALVNAGYKVS